jgi:CTP synthase
VMVERVMQSKGREVKIGVVAKYMDNQDTYMSVFEALRSAAWANDVKADIEWIDAEALEADPDYKKILDSVEGIVVPGGFGTRGLEGKIKAARYCLDTKKPYLGLCLGLQMAVIAAARNAGIKDATSAELNASGKNKIIHTMAGQKGKENTGGTMRLGDYPCDLADGSLAAKVYDTSSIIERHRHRYECNNDYRDQYESWGIRAVGISPDGHLVEMIEAIDHPFFLASQFHPEFKSRPNRAHPMFKGFVASLLQK